ncbi:cyclin-K isoform X3 [Hypomesus transpacificus]|uniref:cyclin-K isoform X3 n=1 Tax=Hypomesus transpacificus TaxID=137520 RepID=UPI001F071754|nr:cyclin-K isoform X3 [Hypomesus transpacificus]
MFKPSSAGPSSVASPHQMKENKENSTLSGQAFLDHIKPCWYWDKKDLAHTPSQSEGLDPATEARYRREGARFIFDVGTRLGLHYDTLATGIIYFHRFYMFHSFKQFPRYVTGACCLFLAGKVEETPKKCKDIIKTARSLLNDVQFAQFGDDPKEEVMVLERILLQTIKFDLQVEHPYMFLLRYAKQLKGDKNKVQKLVQMAWTFVNDSLCTMLSLQWEPEIIAVAVMYLAGRLCKFDIQEWTSKQSSRRWWEQFVQDVPVELLEDICHQILDLYSQGKQPIPPQLQEKERGPPLPPAPPTPQGPPPSSNPPPPPPKKNSPQGSPPRQLKRPHASPKEEVKVTEQVGSKIPRLESPMPPLPTTQPPPGESPLHDPLSTTQPPPDRKAPIPAPPTEAEPPAVSESAPPLPQAPPPHQPPPLPHRPPPPPPPSSYIMGMSTSSSYMSGEGYQSLQSMMKTEGPSYAPMPPNYGPPMPYHPHSYPPPNAPPPGPPPPTSYMPPALPPHPSPSYPPPGYNPSYPHPPPRMPPGHGVPPPGMGMPPAGYPPPPVPPGQALPPPPGMPMPNRGWMR